jgi:hypothetical protein
MSIYTQSSFKPTYLYIKQHSITGKLYFGKTIKNHDKMLSYLGSGKYWTNHITEHGKQHTETLWYCLYYEEVECSNFALAFSKNQSIVGSSEWANLKEENGATGGHNGKDQSGKNNHFYGKHHTTETKGKIAESIRNMPDDYRKKLSDSSTGRKHTYETKQKMSESHTGRTGYWKGKTKSDDFKSTVSATLKGRPKTEEHKAKISAAKKKQP